MDAMDILTVTVCIGWFSVMLVVWRGQRQRREIERILRGR